MARKAYRELTVGELGNYGRKATPFIRLNGLWLFEVGFNIGDPVLVKCEDGKLIITLDTARAELKKKEQEFMEVEMKKLHAKYEKERRKLRQQCVAEQTGTYGK